MSLDRFNLDGRVALVTDGGPGLGLAIARGLAAAGATVAINGRDRAKLEDAAGSTAGVRLRLFGEPEEFIGAAVYFASAASDFVTRQVLFVDGGFSASM